MPFDPSQDPLDTLVSRPRRAPPALMIAGVLGACTLGGALGFWARPTDDDVQLLAQRTAHSPAAAAQPRQIEIRVDRPPAAATPAEPLATESAVEAPSATTAPPDPQPELLAPKRPPTGLVKVHAVAPERLVEPDEAAVRRARLAAERKVKADAQARAAAERKAEAARAEREAEAREARAEARAAELRRARKEAARIADAAEAKARAKAERKAAEQVAAKQAAAEKREARLAAERKAQRLAEQKLAEQKRRAAPKAVAAAAPVRTVKVAKASTRCASPDPGAAMACSDPALSAAERQLSRAYRQAEAAGVPSETLERQQQRWLAARANAARKAPWAVHDIYLARIAELQDQTRQADRGEDF